MRATINLKPYLQKEIVKNHPECFERYWDLYSVDERYEDELLVLSTYNHRLTEQEASTALVEGHPDHPEYYDRMYRFFVYLDNTFSTFLIRRKKKRRYRSEFVLKKIIDQERCLFPKHFLMDDRVRLELLIPTLNMAIWEISNFSILVSAPLESRRIITEEALKFKIYDIG